MDYRKPEITDQSSPPQVPPAGEPSDTDRDNIDTEDFVHPFTRGKAVGKSQTRPEEALSAGMVNGLLYLFRRTDRSPSQEPRR